MCIVPVHVCHIRLDKTPGTIECVSTRIGHYQLQPTLSESSSLAGVGLMSSQQRPDSDSPSTVSSTSQLLLHDVSSDMDVTSSSAATAVGYSRHGSVSPQSSSCDVSGVASRRDVVIAMPPCADAAVFRTDSVTSPGLSATTRDSQEQLTSRDDVTATSSRMSGGAMSHRSSSSSENSTCELLKAHAEQRH